MDQYRQGDVYLIAIDQLPDNLIAQGRDLDGRIVLAYGETTGHAHAILDRNVKLYRELTDKEIDDRFLQVLTEGGVDLVHEEHDTIHLPAGNYTVRRQREYTPERIIQVAD